ncbi:Serine protease inhibitor (serpin family) [Enhygromyxa salina]|uniref:Serine protease inhibitor (Serpin family) n=1 Tax=Enhygromyxa salina TaxID=215803 RepID=A0A0C2CZY9_9BACT|nr:serpin family protein [Enhygromyxa salina]KIG16546.1 Serine protease inhibitor (serpin family) [Enhygromyxa salina]
MRRIGWVGALLGAALLCACPGTELEGEAGGGEETHGDDGDDGDDGAGWNIVQSELPRDIHPMPTPEEMAALAGDQLELALDLYHALRTDPANQSFCVSAYSLQHMFGMLYGGSSGVAKAQMQAALRFSLADDRQHVALNWQELELAERNIDAIEGSADPLSPLVLRTVNGFWLEQELGAAVETDYLDLLGVNYGAGINLADFSSDQAADTERQAINAWLSERTNGELSAVVPDGALDERTTAVVANALVLEAPWMAPFAMDKTAKHPFRLGDGSEVAVDMMSNPALEARYTRGPDFAALAIPLRGVALELVLVVPEGELEAFEAGLDAAGVTALLEDLNWEQVDTQVPRFQLRSALPLTSVLADQLNMPAPFNDPGAFTGIVGEGIGVLDAVFHDSVIAVDEHGLEAAPGSGAVAASTATADPAYAFSADEPFIVMIHDRPTRTLLLLGRVLDPREP